MEITDSQGMVITVTDIEASIAMVEDFISYSHIDADEGIRRFDEQRKAYWTDIHEKLLQLKNSDNGQ